MKKIKRKIGHVKIHFHASPRVEFCPTNRNSDTKKLGDSVGTFQWTVNTIGYLNEKFKDNMTWSIEDNPHLAGNSDKIFQKEENKEKLVVKINNKKKFNYELFRRQLESATGSKNYGAYDFSLLGVPQRRVRFLAFDDSISFDQKNKLTDEQLQKWLQVLEGTYLFDH